MDQNTQQPNTEVQHVEALAVSTDVIGQMEHAAIDCQIATAHAYPRSLKKFKDTAIEMVKSDQETAESCVYCRPVGKDASGKQTYAEGMSIRMAEIVSASYGNLRVAAVISEQTPRYVKAIGMAHDLESNLASKSEVVESCVKRNGQPYDERMRVVVAKAALAKARRDAIFQVIPRSLCKPIEAAARAVISGAEKPIGARRAAVGDWLKKFPLDSNKQPFDEKRVFFALGVAGLDDLNEEHLIQLKGIATALKDNEVTLDEAFPPVPVEQPAAEGDKSTLKGRIGAKTGKGSKDTPPPAKVEPEASQTPPATK